MKRSIIAIVAILPTVAALPAATQASSTGVVQLSSVTAGPVCDKFSLNGVVWAINSTEFNAGMRMSLILARALADLPVAKRKRHLRRPDGTRRDSLRVKSWRWNVGQVPQRVPDTVN